jgi:hypothetical protein
MAKKTIVGDDGKQYTVKEKKPIYKRVWFWILAVVIVGGIASSGGDSDKDSSDSASSPESSQVTSNEAAKDSTKAESSKEKVFGVGSSQTVSKVEYKLNSIETKDILGESNEFMTEKATAKFLVVNVTITNKGDEAITVDSDFFKLLNGKTKYEPAGYSVQTAANLDAEGQDSFFLNELNPNMSLTGNVVFDVPEAAIAYKGAQLQVQTGFWGTQTGVFALN